MTSLSPLSAEPSVPPVAETVEQTVTISEPGHYFLKPEVGVITCPTRKFTIVDANGVIGLHKGSLFAPASVENHWVYVTEDDLKEGPIEFTVTTCVGATDFMPRQELEEMRAIRADVSGDAAGALPS